MTLGGYVKLDAIANSNRTGVHSRADQSFDPTSIPVGPGAGANEKSQLTLHARQSRLFLTTSTPSSYGEVATKPEFDLFGTSGNDGVSNSRNLRLRHAYGSVGAFLAGLTRSNFQALGAGANTLEFGGPVAVPLIRKAQVRWTQPFSGGQWSVALENPETSFSGPSGAGVRADDDRLPDLTGKISFNTSCGQYWVTGLVRQLRIDTPTERDSRTAGGIGRSGAIPVGSKDRLGFGLNAGNGIGRSRRQIPDVRLAALYALTAEMVRTQGRPDAKIVQTFLGAGFQERDLLYVILAIAVKTLSNYSNHAFATRVDAVFSAYKVD